MKELTLMVRTADQARKAELQVSSHNTGADIIQGAITNWSLPKDTDYTIVNVTSGRALNQHDTLAMAGVNDHDELEIQPVLVAGATANTDARIRRRQEDLRKLNEMSREFAGRIDKIQTIGIPISQITLRLRLPTAANEDYPNTTQDTSDVRIELDSNYPFRQPRVAITSEIWNPNIFPSGDICLGTKWLPTEGLDLLVLRVMKVLTFDASIINLESPANARAATWYRKRKAQFPANFPSVIIHDIRRSASAPRIVWRNMEDAHTVTPCPSCRVNLRVRANTTTMVRCPRCSTVFGVGQ